MSDIIDINIYPTVETISLTIAPNLTTINVNTVSGGGGAVDSVNGQTGVVVLNQDDVLDGTTYKQYSQTEKTKLAGIAAGAEVNVNSDWNAVSGDALILNKPTIPSVSGFVPYSGATQDVNLGEFGIQLGNLEFDLTPTNVPTGVGSMLWNDTAGTLDLKLKGGAVTLQIGQETVARVVNKTATNITLLESNYQVVRVTGAQGQRPKVDLALANNDLNSTTTLGLVTENILNNAEGFITTSGQVQQINTTGSLQGETWADGDVLYLSGTVAGQATNIKPAAPIHTVIIGFVEYVHINQGKIFVKVDNGYELEELHNVSAIAPNNNEVLTYDTATLLWKPKTVQTTIDSLSNGLAYFLPVSGTTTFNSILRTNAPTLSGNSAVNEAITNILFSTTATAGTLAFQRGSQITIVLSAISFLNYNRKFKINSNVTDTRFFCGISTMYGASNPTNVAPDTQINTVGVCKMASSQNLQVLYNDATGLATLIDLGVNFPANNVVDYWYNLNIKKENNSSDIVITVKRTDVTGAYIVAVNTIITNYNNTLNHNPLMWISNNATAAIASYKDYGCISEFNQAF